MGVRSSLLRAVLRRLPLAGTLLGLGLAIWLVATNDMAAIGSAFARIGPLGLAAIVAVRLVIILVCGLAWSRILDGLTAIPIGAFAMLRFVREGINVLLPVASVGGEFVGGRLLTFWGASGPVAAASILADLLLQAATLAVFALIGALMLLQVEGEAAAAVAQWALRALAVMGIVLAVFFGFQRGGTVLRIARVLSDLSRRVSRDTPNRATPDKALADMQDALDTVWARRRRGHLARSAALHLLAWAMGALEIWIALACIGVGTIGFAEVIVVEALTQAIRTAAFPVPSGLGVQEGGFVLVGGLFGLDAGTALALSLAKRVPDVALGLPSMILWQNLEARRATIVPPGSG